MWQQYKLDSRVARRAYDAAGDFNFCNHDLTDFSSYSPAFLSTNESVTELMHCLMPRGKTALAVVGSGDVPLLLSGYGAKRVDMFDISINAYLVMRIKMHMFNNNFNMSDYDGVLNGLSDVSKFTKSPSWKIVCDTFQNDKSVTEYLYQMDGCKVFGFMPENLYWKMDTCEYDAVKRGLHKDYKFIWSDLYDLPQRLGRKKYDIIYLSNIVQYAGDDLKIKSVVKQLELHLNSHGTIVLDSLNPMYSDEYEFLNDSHCRVEFSELARSVFVKQR